MVVSCRFLSAPLATPAAPAAPARRHNIGAENLTLRAVTRPDAPLAQQLLPLGRAKLGQPGPEPRGPLPIAQLGVRPLQRPARTAQRPHIPVPSTM